MTFKKESAVVPDVRSGRKFPVRIPRPGPGGVSGPLPLPGPDWNGIPGYPFGVCQPKLMVNLTLNRDFCGPIIDEIDHCIHYSAVERAREEMVQQNPTIPRSRLGEPPEDRVNHWKHSLDIIDRCLEDAICYLLQNAEEHHRRCKHELIVVLLPEKYAQQIMTLQCWKDFAQAMAESGVDWYPAS